MSTYFMETDRIGFSRWTEEDTELAFSLWGEADVSRYICASGRFTPQEIEGRLRAELENERKYQVQYWPIFERKSGDLIGCCGARPFPGGKGFYEIGFHLRKKYWGQGYASEAARQVIRYCFESLHAEMLFAGHHPNNAGSKKVLSKLGFVYIGDNFYEPTGLYHPSYELKRKNVQL